MAKNWTLPLGPLLLSACWLIDLTVAVMRAFGAKVEVAA